MNFLSSYFLTGHISERIVITRGNNIVYNFFLNSLDSDCDPSNFPKPFIIEIIKHLFPD